MRPLLALLAFALAGLGGSGCTPDPAPEVDRAALAADWRAWVAGRDSLFRSGATPLLPRDTATFDGLDYFPYDSALAVPAALVPALERDTFAFPTTSGTLQPYVTAGHLVFAAGGVQRRLEAFEPVGDPTRLFVPFRDATNRAETYGGGRYLDLPTDSTAVVALDLNRAYNPYCVYNVSYSCPLPPAENVLSFPVTAGERMPSGYGAE